MHPAPLGLRYLVTGVAVREDTCVAFAHHLLRDPVPAGPLWGSVSHTGHVLIKAPGSLRQAGEERGLIDEVAVCQSLCVAVTSHRHSPGAGIVTPVSQMSRLELRDWIADLMNGDSQV